MENPLIEPATPVSGTAKNALMELPVQIAKTLTSDNYYRTIVLVRMDIMRISPLHKPKPVLIAPLRSQIVISVSKTMMMARSTALTVKPLISCKDRVILAPMTVETTFSEIPPQETAQPALTPA